MRRDIALIALVWLITIALGLGARSFWNPDEARHAEVAREMYQDGSMLQPVLSGNPYPDKPPLFFWMAGFIPWLVGHFTPLTLRLASAIAGLGSSVTLYWFSRILYGRRAALLSGVILLTTLEFAWLSQRVDMNPWVAWVVLTSVALGVRGAQSNQQIYWAACFALMGVGILLKGPVVVLLPGVVLLSWLSVAYGWQGLARCSWRWSPLVLVAPAIWVLPLMVQGQQGYLHEMLFTHALIRVAISPSHQQPLTYYVLQFPLIAFPWIAFLLPSWRELLRGGELGRERGWLPILWVVVPFAVMSMISSKRGLYLLPTLPGVAIAVGFWFSTAWQRGHAVRSLWLRVPAVAVGACYGLSSLAVVLLHPQFLPPNQEGWRWLALTFALGAFGVVWAARRAQPRVIFIGTASCMAAAFLVFRGLVAPALDPWLSHSDIAAYLEREREVATPLVAVGFDPAGASLLLNRTIPRVAEDPLKLSDASPRSVLLEYDERRQLAPEVFARRGLHLAALFRIGHRRIAVTRTHPVPQASLYRQPAAPPWIGGRGVERSSWKAIQQASWGQWFAMAGTILALLSLCMPNGRQGQMPVGDDGAGRKELQRQR